MLNTYPVVGASHATPSSTCLWALLHWGRRVVPPVLAAALAGLLLLVGGIGGDAGRWKDGGSTSKQNGTGEISGNGTVYVDSNHWFIVFFAIQPCMAQDDRCRLPDDSGKRYPAMLNRRMQMRLEGKNWQLYIHYIIQLCTVSQLLLVCRLCSTTHFNTPTLQRLISQVRSSIFWPCSASLTYSIPQRSIGTREVGSPMPVCSHWTSGLKDGIGGIFPTRWAASIGFWVIVGWFGWS